jgi:glutamate-1-semialdehyde 2,1-aminomutase
VAAFGGTTGTMTPLARNEAFHAGVYAGNHAAMAAVVSMLTRIRDETDLYQRLEAVSQHAETRLREVFAAAHRAFWIGRSGSVISVALATRPLAPDEETSVGPIVTDYDAHRELQARCQAGGVYFHPDPREPWFLSTRHTVADIDTVCAVVAAALLDLP